MNGMYQAARTLNADLKWAHNDIKIANFGTFAGVVKLVDFDGMGPHGSPLTGSYVTPLFMSARDRLRVNPPDGPPEELTSRLDRDAYCLAATFCWMVVLHESENNAEANAVKSDIFDNNTNPMNNMWYEKFKKWYDLNNEAYEGVDDVVQELFDGNNFMKGQLTPAGFVMEADDDEYFSDGVLAPFQALHMKPC
jgi:hypothetical protein